MPPAAEEGATDGSLDDPSIRRQVRCLQVGQFLRSVQYTLTITAQTSLALRLTGGDHARVASVISTCMGASSFLELLLSPLCGRLSDLYGRKPILLLGGAAKCVPYLLMALRPSMGGIIFSTLLTDVSFHTYRLAETSLLADMLTGLEPLAVASTSVSSMMGLAAIIGNIAGGSLSAISLRLPYLVAAACTAGNAAVVLFGLKETAGKRVRGQTTVAVAARAGEGGPVSHPSGGGSSGGSSGGGGSGGGGGGGGRRSRLPALLCRGPRLRLLTVAAMLSEVVDLTFPIRPIFAQTTLGLSLRQYGYAEATRGICTLFSGRVSRFVLSRLGGARPFSLLAHAVCALYHALLSVASRPWHLFLSYPPMMLGGLGVRNSGVIAMHAREGEACGLGVGETAAGLRFLCSINSILFQPLFGWMYSALGPGVPWAVAGCFAVASGIVIGVTPEQSGGSGGGGFQRKKDRCRDEPGLA